MATKARVGKNGNLTPAPRRSYQKPQTSTPDVQVVREPAAYQGIQMAEEVTPYQMIQEYDPAVDAALIHSWEEVPAEPYLDDFGMFDIFQEGGNLPKKPITEPTREITTRRFAGNNIQREIIKYPNMYYNTGQLAVPAQTDTVYTDLNSLTPRLAYNPGARYVEPRLKSKQLYKELKRDYNFADQALNYEKQQQKIRKDNNLKFF